MSVLKARLQQLIARLTDGLVERGRHVRLALLAALAAEHVLLVGPPGTAKSELARRLHRAFRDAVYFERLLTRFSVPEELFGPLSIAALEQDRYERQTAGFLPQATVAFIDEVFKANSAILNALLTLLNEREFDNGARREATPLVSVIGASNEVPQDEVIAAFYDRFLLRLPVEPVSAGGFARLLREPPGEWTPPSEALAFTHGELGRIVEQARGVALPEDIAALLEELRAHLAAQHIYVSDRRWVAILRLLQTAARTDARDAVSIWDLWLLQFCAGDAPEQRSMVARWYEERLGSWAALTPVRFTRVVEAFEAQLQIEQSASDLNFDDSGQLALAEQTGDAKGGAQAPRMSFMRGRRFGPTHIGARTAQVDAALAQARDYLAALDARIAEAGDAANHLWLDREFAERAAAVLAATRDNVAALAARLAAARAGFAALPRLASDSGIAPEPVALP